MLDTTIYLVNHTQRIAERTSLYEALSRLEYLKKYNGLNHGDFTWGSTDEVQIIDEPTFFLLEQEWKTGGYSLAFDLLRKNAKLFWCCHADGPIQKRKDGTDYTSDEEYFWDRIKDLCYNAQNMYEHDHDNAQNMIRYGKFWEIYRQYIPDLYH